MSANKMSKELHRIFNSMRRLRYTDIDSLELKNCVYIIFEEGEKYAGTNLDRIVRVGQATDLKARMKEHFARSKDNSIFRKNIGRAFLTKDNDMEFLNHWNSSDDEAKNTDEVKYEETEKRITDYLREKISFVAFEVTGGKKSMDELEEIIISTLCNDEKFKASDNWLGKYVGGRVKECGMWVVQHTKKDLVINESHIDNIKEYIRRHEEI